VAFRSLRREVLESRPAIQWSHRQNGHDISKPYADVRKFADDLLPASPVKPQRMRMPEAMWRSETFEEFIGRGLSVHPSTL
jgi:hypothetical protein